MSILTIKCRNEENNNRSAMVEFHVLRCVLCQTFQVLQVTKTSKWKCKMCGEKQSIIKVYGQGTGADCRKHVQKLNSIQGCISQELQQSCLTSALSVAPQTNTIDDGCVIKKELLRNSITSRWAHFLDGSDDVKHTVESEPFAHDSHVTTDYNEFQNNKKRKRQETQHNYNKWTKQSSAESNKDNTMDYDLPRTHIKYGNENTKHDLSQVTHTNYRVDSHDLKRSKEIYPINLSNSGKTTYQPSTPLHCNSTQSGKDFAQSINQDSLSQPEKLCSLVLNCSGGVSQSGHLSPRTNSCIELHTLAKNTSNPVKINAARRNVKVSSLKWASFLENDNDEEEDEEISHDGVSGPVFVTSLNKVCQEDNVSDNVSEEEL